MFGIAFCPLGAVSDHVPPTTTTDVRQRPNVAGRKSTNCSCRRLEFCFYVRFDGDKKYLGSIADTEKSSMPDKKKVDVSADELNNPFSGYLSPEGVDDMVKTLRTQGLEVVDKDFQVLC